MQYITNTSAIIILFKNGKRVRVEKTDKRYARILKVFSLPFEEQESAVELILNATTSVNEVVKKEADFEIIGENIVYKGETLPPAFATKVQSIIRDQLPLDHFKRFWENLVENTSYHVVNENGFFDFLEYKELPLTEDGCFLAYRGVRDDFWSLSGNTNTVVLQGTVNSSGQIFNGIGETIEVRRNGVCDDRNVHCHNQSLHIGSLDYAKGWGPKVIIVKVNPKDVVSVPNDCSCQKARVCKYEVVGEYVEEIVASVVDDKGNDTLTPKDSQLRDEFITRVETYVLNKLDQGFDEVTIRQIQSIFSPVWPSKEEVMDALQALGMSWGVVDGVTVVDLNSY